jgi:hypothetical protein
MKLPIKIVVLFMLLISSAKAQHDHSSHSHDNGAAHEHKAEPPHGGEIRDIGKYHFEIVFDAFTANEKLNVWILKSNLKVIDPKEFTGKVKIQYADGKEVEKILAVNTYNQGIYCIDCCNHQRKGIPCNIQLQRIGQIKKNR